MAEIVKTRGSLYFLRDVDYLTGEKGAYVKIGIVRKDKKTETRIKEHQTGNPRGIIDEYTLADVPFVEALETHLHYHFNEHWITGEWFHMDEEFVKKVVVEEAERLRQEQLTYERQINAAEALSAQLSNGQTRKPNKVELKMRDVHQLIKFNIEVADAKLKIAKSALIQSIGKYGSVAEVFHLSKSKDAIKFDATAFKNANQVLYDSYCFEKEGGFQKTFKVEGGPKLKIEDETLYNKSKAVPKESYSNAQLSKDKKRSKKIEALHWAYLEAQRASKLLDWELTKLEAQLKTSCGHYDAIDETCTWVRKQKDSTMSFDEKLFEEKEPKEYLKYLKVKSGNFIGKIELTRAYKPK